MWERFLKPASFAPRKPKFRLFCIGLPKTGTTSIAHIFRRYRSGHEVWFAKTVSSIEKWQKGRISGEAFRWFVMSRVTENGLEMDSSSFNHYYLDILLDEFPEGKFILTVRDFKSWLNSYLSMLLRWRQAIPQEFRIPEWHLAYGRCQFGVFDPQDFVSTEKLKVSLPEIADRFFACWAQSYSRIFRLMDGTRTLVLKTGRISSSMQAIGIFVGIQASTLDETVSHSNRVTGAISLTDFLLPTYFEKLCVPSEVKDLFALAEDHEVADCDKSS